MKWDAVSFRRDILFQRKLGITVIICSAVACLFPILFFILLNEVIVCITMEKCIVSDFFFLSFCRIRPVVETMPSYLTNYCRRTFVPVTHTHHPKQFVMQIAFRNSWKNAMPFDMNFACGFHHEMIFKFIRYIPDKRRECLLIQKVKCKMCVIRLKCDENEQRTKKNIYLYAA